ncbi:MAG TPA: glycogen debranching enzyme N-terminal domain-containing protein, partial [Ktedonobacteraceae bacterium]|nr:glycogen debranching enzyme N-terminal domain-containing protein [Ktedonobacteraceae bacterium]
MPIAFDRSVCCDLNETISREWLLTNGLGGYASGTVSGTLTRLEQGLLVASPQEGTQPQLLVAKLDEEIVFDQRTYYLGTNEYKDGTLNPAGFVHLETFRLEEGFPVFTYHLGGIDGIVLEKRIWMPERLNTTYIQYRVLRTNSPQDITPWNNRASHAAYTRVHDAQRVLSLTLLPLAAYRPGNEAHHADHDRQFQVEAHHAEQDDDSSEVNDSIAGCTIRAGEDARPYHIFAVGHPESQSTFLPTGVWYWNFLHREDEAAGRTANDDLYLPGVFRTRLWPGEDVSLTIIITAEELSRQTFSVKHLIHAYNEAVDYQRNILQTQRYFGEGGAAVYTHPTLPFPEKNDDLPQGEEFLRLLMQAGNRFLVERPVARDDAAGGHSFFFPHVQNIPVIIPGYYSAQESTRDMLIALPGLLLTTHKYAEARRILSELGRHFKQGLLPDRLPAPREDDGRATTRERSYGGIDTTLWYFYSLDHYTQATRDYELLDSLASNLEECIDLYIRGTLNGTGVDAQDGLLRTQVHADDGATTRERPHGRQGKAVEINALWYLALSLMHEWSEQGAINRTHLTLRQGKAAEVYEEWRQQCRCSFNERFWYALGGYLYDV